MENLKNKLVPTIKLENVSMYYSNENNINVGFSKISLEFFKGEFVAVTGESGSGKTSLINVIGAHLPYHEGEIYYDGEPSSHFGDEDRETFRRNRIGYVCQNYNLIDSYTLLQNVVASMIITGISEKEAKEKALIYLDKVGLKELANKKASHISSGQKQRLGIARALAKETDIILADEPTGNLDSENGAQIVQILKELSKDHLVIMVTHNIDEAIDQVTRVIRLSDGHVVFDEIKNTDNELLTCEVVNSKEQNIIKNAWTFASFNRKAKPKRAFVLCLFLLLLSFSSFVLIGTIICNLDESLAKVYDESLFYNHADNRLILTKDDDSAFTNEDIDKIRDTKYVILADKYDLANDFNYYTEDDLTYEYFEEYQYYPDGGRDDSSRVDHKSPLFRNNDKFVKSSTCITSDMILDGVLPSKTTEIAVYGNKDLIGTTLKVFLKNRKYWDQNYVSFDMTITCVLKPNGDVNKNQIYFSEVLCKELLLNDYYFVVEYTCQDTTKSYPNGFNRMYMYMFTEELGQSNIVLSHNLFTVGTNYDALEITLFGQKFDLYSHSGLQGIQVVKIDTYYEELYINPIESYQASVYIEDYAYTDEAINLLNKKGFNAISTYRLSTVEYDEDKLVDKYISIAFCAGALIVIFVLTLFVIVAFLGLNKNDYLLLRLLGMNKRTMYLTNLFELGFMTILVFALTLVITIVLDIFNVSIVHNIVKYMEWYQFIIIFFIVMIIVYTTTNRFNRRLEKKVKANGVEK